MPCSPLDAPKVGRSVRFARRRRGGGGGGGRGLRSSGSSGRRRSGEGTGDDDGVVDGGANGRRSDFVLVLKSENFYMCMQRFDE